MKKLLILIFALMLLLSFCIGAYAQEIVPGDAPEGESEVVLEESSEENVEDPTVEDEVVPEEIPGETVVDPPSIEPEENPGQDLELPPEEEGAGVARVETILTRVLEWWKTYSEEIMAIGGFIITGIFTAVAKFLSNKIGKIGDKTDKKIAESYGLNAEKTNELVEAYNENVKVLDRVLEQLKGLSDQINSLKETTLQTEEIEESIARILTTAYTNSRLPNGTKEMINTECAQIINKVHGYSSVIPTSDITEESEDEKQD